MDRISVIVPCFNEEESIPYYLKKMEGLEWEFAKREVELELILVDDGSTDGTLNVIRQEGSKKKNLRYLSFTRNFGKEASLLAGIREAKGDLVAVMDVDLQDPPELLIRMYQGIREGNKLCLRHLFPEANQINSFSEYQI